MKMEEEKLEAQMEYARYEHETEILRERKFCWVSISVCLIWCVLFLHVCRSFFAIQFLLAYKLSFQFQYLIFQLM
jgi:hypothetical protein